MIMMDSSTFIIQNPNERQHKILKNSTLSTTDKQQLTTMKQTDLADTTLINTNHNSNYYQIPFNSPLIRSTNGTTINNFQTFSDNLEARGVNALHRRAEQLKRWKEAEDEFEFKKQTNHCNLINKSTLIFRKKDNDDDRKIKFSNSTLFLAACASSDYDEINRLLNNNLVDINVGNIDGLTALHHGCIDDNAKLVEFLLQKGADVNCVDNEGWTPLHATASCDHLKIARILLDYGADCTLVNVDGELAVDLAEDDEMHKLLKDALFEQEKITDFDKLRRQEEERMREDVLEMIRLGIYDNKIHKRTGATIIHVAACKGYLEILQLLFENKQLKNQIDINVKDNEGWTPLAAATYWNKPLVVELLLQNGADVNCVTYNNQTLEQLTDYELILNLIATRREQLKKQETLRSQDNKENGNLNKSNSNVESETQRKAHAKRIRESRRSTQGISAEDVVKAKDQLLMNSTVINVNSNNDDKQSIELKTAESNKVEITKLETINEINTTNDESNLIQSIPTTLHKTSIQNDNCEIVEVKSILDSVDGQHSKIREFTRPYRPKITVDENDEDNIVELKATINLNSDENLNNNDKDELKKDDVVLNLRRDSLNILHQRKDTKKSVALNHNNREEENTNSVCVEQIDYQLPSKLNSITISNREIKRDISQDSLDEKLNGNDYIGINSTLNYSKINKDDNKILVEKSYEPQNYQSQNKQQNQIINKLDRQQSIDKTILDKQIKQNLDQFNNDNIQSRNYQQTTNESISNYMPTTIKQLPLNKQQQTVKFEVPVLIETPCTPEPIDEQQTNSESIDETPKQAKKINNSFDNESENNLTSRKKNTKRRIDNLEDIDVLFNETINNINPKYTRNIDNQFNDQSIKNNYLPSSSSNKITTPSNKSNGNAALKLYKKMDDDNTKVSPLIRIVNPVYKLFRKVIDNSNVWNKFKRIVKKENNYSKLDGDLHLDKIKN